MKSAIWNPSVHRGSDEDLVVLKGLPITDWTGVTAKVQLRDKDSGETGTVRSTFTIGTGITVSIVDGAGRLKATFSSDPNAANTSVLTVAEYDYDVLITDAAGAKLYYLEGVCKITKRTTV